MMNGIRKSIVMLLSYLPILIYGQEFIKIEHIESIENINGIQVEVSSSGAVSTINHCSIGPYWIGQDSLNGSFTFKFTPSISALKLDFCGINSTNIGFEEIELSINGQHYPFLERGDSLTCSSTFPPFFYIPQITSNGNLSGTIPSYVYGSKEIVVNHQIDSITLYNKVISGKPNGTTFSIYLLESPLNTVESNKDDKFVKVYPNPSRNYISIDFNSKTKVNSYSIYNCTGQLVLKGEINETIINVNVKDLDKGLYFINLGSKYDLIKFIRN